MRRMLDFLRKRRPGVSLDAEFGILWDQQETQSRVSLSGRITIDSSPDLRMLLLQHLQSPACQSLTVDLFQVAYIDTSGLAILVEILRAAHTQGKAFRLSRIRERPRYLLEATRLLHLFEETDGPQ